MAYQPHFWNGRLLFRYGKIAMDPSCCCTEETSNCCAVDVSSLTELSVTIGGAITGAGVVTPVPDPGLGGYCWSFTGTITIDLDNDCGDELALISVSVSCPIGATTAAEIEVTASGGGGGCSIAGGVQTDPAATASPLNINVVFTTSELFPGGCPCGDGQTITMQITL